MARGVVAASIAVAMALSRVYLGVHWLSDVVAGLVLGTSSVLLAFGAPERLGLRDHAAGSRKPFGTRSSPMAEAAPATDG